MRIVETLSFAALAATTLFSVAGAHGTPTNGELVARGLHENKARRSLEKCSEKLRSRDRLNKRTTKRDALVKRHLLKKRQQGGNQGQTKPNQQQQQQQQQQQPAPVNNQPGNQPGNNPTTSTRAQTSTRAGNQGPSSQASSGTTLTSAVASTSVLTEATSTSAAASTGTSAANLSALFPTVECVLTPELTVGPYYVAGELIREDMREDEYGIELLLDIQVVDVNTCEVIPNAYMDFWHCNSTGVYSGVSAEDTVGLTFLRGIQPTDDDGIVQMITNFPGWYDGRATHLHVAAHVNGTALENSTYTGGTVSHIGQIFFPESILEEVDAADVYNTNSIVRMTNAADMWFPQGNTTEYDATATVEYIGDALTDGLLAYITIGVDTSIDYSETLAAGVSAGGDGGDGGAMNGTMPNGTMPSGGIPSGSGVPSGIPSSL